MIGWTAPGAIGSMWGITASKTSASIALKWGFFILLSEQEPIRDCQWTKESNLPCTANSNDYGLYLSWFPMKTVMKFKMFSRHSAEVSKISSANRRRKMKKSPRFSAKNSDKQKPQNSDEYRWENEKFYCEWSTPVQYLYWSYKMVKCYMNNAKILDFSTDWQEKTKDLLTEWKSFILFHRSKFCFFFQLQNLCREPTWYVAQHSIL